MNAILVAVSLMIGHNAPLPASHGTRPVARCFCGVSPFAGDANPFSGRASSHLLTVLSASTSLYCILSFSITERICIFATTKRFKPQPVPEVFDVEFPSKILIFVFRSAGLLLDIVVEGEVAIFGNLWRVCIVETIKHKVKNELNRIWYVGYIENHGKWLWDK